MTGMRALRQFAAEALAIHHEHRERDLEGARSWRCSRSRSADAPPAPTACATGWRGSIRKIAKKTDAQLLWS